MRAMRPGPCAALRGVCVKGWLKALQKALTLGEAGVSAFSASVDPSVIVLAYSWPCWCGCPVPLFCTTSCLECVGTQALSGTCALFVRLHRQKALSPEGRPRERPGFPWAAHAPPSPAAGWSARSRCFASCHMATSSSVRDWRRSIMRLRWRVRAFRLADAAATSFFFFQCGPPHDELGDLVREQEQAAPGAWLSRSSGGASGAAAPLALPGRIAPAIGALPARFATRRGGLRSLCASSSISVGHGEPAGGIALQWQQGEPRGERGTQRWRRARRLGPLAEDELSTGSFQGRRPPLGWVAQARRVRQQQVAVVVEERGGQQAAEDLRQGTEQFRGKSARSCSGEGGS